MKPRAIGIQILKATGIAMAGWITPRIYDLLTLREGAIHLQDFSIGCAVELLWIVLMCGIGLGLYRFVGHHQSSLWMSFLMLVMLPTGVIYVHHVTIGNRYAVIYFDKQTVTLSGRPYSASRTFLISDIAQVHLVNRREGAEMEMEFLLRSGEKFRTCHVYGVDPRLVTRLREVIQKLSLLGISISESNIPVAPT